MESVAIFNKIGNLTTFSGSDIHASMSIPGGKDYVIGELSTISYSTHREINPVRTLGRINPAGFVRGPRTIGGSLIFTVFDRSMISNFSKDLKEFYEKRNSRQIPNYIMTDEMPPFNITISLHNEFGASASIRILHVLIMNEGQVMSTNDVMTEQTMQFIAKEIRPLEGGVL